MFCVLWVREDVFQISIQFDYKTNSKQIQTNSDINAIGREIRHKGPIATATKREEKWPAKFGKICEAFVNN